MNTPTWHRGAARPAPRPSSPAICGRGVRLAFLLSSLLACGDGGTGPQSSVIGEKGGTASLAGGAITLSIPAGALATPVEFTAAGTTSIPQTGLLSGSAYEVGPAGTTFAGNATLTMAYDPDSLPVGVKQAELRLQKVVGVGWQLAIGSSVDSARHVVTGQIQSVGRFGVVAIPVATVSLNPSRYTLGAGRTTQLYTSMRGPFGEALPYRRVTWTSMNEAVAAVDSAGMVTGVGGGGTTITASVEGRSATASIAVYDCSTQTRIAAKECLALIAVYDGITQSEWRSTYTWVVGADPCGWRGVACAGGSVSELNLRSAAYNVNGGPYPGVIPYTGDLANLTWLDLSGNRLSGQVPSSLGSLTKLEMLNLSSNALSGSIPPELSGLSSLTEMRLDNNKLSGPIPPELGSLASIRVLYLGGNQLSGSIPRQLGGLASLRFLWLGANELTGGIPKELGSLSNLTDLVLSYNQLSGSIPGELGGLSNLVDLALTENRLSGSIPAEIGNLSSLQMLFLSGNTLTGAVPLSVAQLGGRIQAQHVRSDCLLTPPGNTGLSMPDSQDFRDADLDADGLICGIRIGSQ